MAKSVYKSIFSHMATAEYADTPKQFLKLTKECSERTQKMTTPSAFSSPPKVNSELCKHLADKLKSAVERAQSFLHRRFLSLEDKAKYIDAFKLFYGLANMAVKVIRSCCQEEWIQAAFLMTNVPEHILSTSFDLEMLNHFFSGSLTSTEVLESIFKAEVAIVNMKASHDRESLVGDVYALLRRGESGSTETYRLASLTLEKLDPQRQNLGGSSSGAYRVDMESLKEMEQLGKEGKRESCMVMELMDGDLCGLIQKIMAKDEHRGSPFSMLEAVDLMLQVGRGMEYLHEMRIVHRDLKAMNILVKQVKGKDGRSWYIWAKVADFGLSKTKHNSVTYSNQTLNTGTTRWMAPEMIKESVNEGQEQVSNVGMTAKYPFGGDVYSFAMVCYEILTGDVPFYDIAQPNAVKRMVLKGDRPGLP
uniref:Protein kinase domain-containing protein n=2 Tax=Physcomitrium patens TaxID=3218 RepID=A0A7I4ADA6_PHYPA|nr:light-sensor Protein kinase-like isoform X3 [Physcomitrium patens]|eukprot:XP_024389775.1 light-sensor Protein kinase-like isoform X3 [Physcomitrella patens]